MISELQVKFVFGRRKQKIMIEKLIQIIRIISQVLIAHWILFLWIINGGIAVSFYVTDPGLDFRSLGNWVVARYEK